MYSITGESVSGFGTSIYVPQLKLCFDIGVITQQNSHGGNVKASVVAISHCHTDHIAAITAHAAIRKLTGLPPARYIVPPGAVEATRQLLATAELLNGDSYGQYQVLSADDEHKLTGNMVLRSVVTDHRVESRGYIVVERRKQPEYAAATGEERKALRESGINIHYDHVLLAYSGDTTIRGLLANPLLLSADQLICECTFLDDVITEEQAVARGHIHVSQLSKAISRGELTCQRLYLTHFSNRHSREQIETVVANLPTRGSVVIAI